MKTERKRQEDRFPDRDAAGKELAALLSSYASRDDILVLGLARGGVAVAHRVAQEPARIVAALPVAQRAVLGELGELADEAVGVHTPGSLEGVRLWYRDFREVTDHEVRGYLEAHPPP